MCGLLTMFGDRWAGDFDAALDALASRGPDERGVWHDPATSTADNDNNPATHTATARSTAVRLGHRRLSVIDLADGHQPMGLCDDGDRYRIVFNGEIYNFPQLRRELETLGRRFVTRSDTEVLLAGFAQWGKDVLPKLDGIFAFVVWDRTQRRAFAARDRFGIKPLVWSTQGDGLIVGSTLAPFYELQGFPRPLDYEALRDFLACQSVLAPHTILQSVRTLPPGASLTWQPGDAAPAIETWWHIPRAAVKQPAWDSLVEQTDAALRESVRRQLVADVPLGAFLSGGIDSSLMVRYMAQASSAGVKTFSVRFPFGAGYDESGPADEVARTFNCEHHVLDAGDLDADFFTRAIAQLDQPLADPAYLPTLALSQLTRQHVTVAISGDGGDELFGGYDRYDLEESRYPNTPGKRLAAALLRARLLPGSLSRRGLAGRERMLWDRVKLGPFPRSRKDLDALLAPQFHAQSRTADTMRAWRTALETFANPRRGADADALMRADLHTYLSENCLVKTDRASMAHALEVRVPLLGNPVADIALPVHADLKRAHGPKSVLVELARRHLPPAVWDRPKHGFSVPLRNYFAGPWKQHCDALVQRTPQLAPFLDAAEVQRRWHTPREDTRTLYTLLVLLAWLDTHAVDL